MIGCQDARYSRVFSGDLLEHGKLVCGYRRIFVDGAFDMPARKIATIRSRKSSGAESSNRCALPVAIIDVCFVFPDSGVFKRLPDGPPPRDLRNFVIRAGQRQR